MKFSGVYRNNKPEANGGFQKGTNLNQKKNGGQPTFQPKKQPAPKAPEVIPSKFITNKKLSTEKGLMNTLLSSYLEQRTKKDGPKTLLVPWLDHPGKTLDKEIDALIDVASTGSVDATPKNEDAANPNRARKSSNFEKAFVAANPPEKSEEVKDAGNPSTLPKPSAQLNIGSEEFKPFFKT